VKEAVVDDHDVVKGLLDFANKNLVHSIVIGASKNPLPRSLSHPL
jgi:K+-sensing histidine kinase KdpD